MASIIENNIDNKNSIYDSEEKRARTVSRMVN